MILELVTKVKYEIDDEVFATLDSDKDFKEAVLNARCKLIGAERTVIENGEITVYDKVYNDEFKEYVKELVGAE